MKQTDDFWFALGYLCSDMKFNFSMQKSATSVNGFKVLRSISFRSYIKQQHVKHENAFLFLNEVLTSFDLAYDKKITTGPDVRKWMTMISHLKLESRLADRVGYFHLKWVIENDPPSDYEGFIEWVKIADKSLSHIKEQNRCDV